MIEVLIKYCGGCNPRYDRGQIVEKLKKQYSTINFTSSIDPRKSWDLVIVLSGCMSSCTTHENLNGKHGKMIVRSLKDYKTLVHKLDEILESNI
ncbi:hypothetical protein NSA47_10195 [Irregularibacter muris]|jgi:4-hydroxybutyrate CoA-transferase|uniref:Uncharacterized protein n=1 Tax=Irregularibacter muris TaxID=1796619 RepID=A0AAE3HHR4_9FIRM|nr:hypothetical protein [Irregularibacter muris]MCR1899353.1 hypothetical protein [Irregularibacter muris]